MFALQQPAAKLAMPIQVQVQVQVQEKENKKSTRRCFLVVTQFRPQAKLSRRKCWRDRAILYPA